jgi:hypothetical protein
MRSLTRVTVTASVVAGLALVGTFPAYAVDDTTSATVEVQGGVLSLSAPENVALSAVVPGATATGALVGVTVTDTRAGLAGWVSSVSITDFASVTTNTSIPSANVSYVPEVAQTVGTVTVTQSTVAAGAGTVQTATAVNGNNTAVWDAALSVLVPTDALTATDYDAVLTHSVI